MRRSLVALACLATIVPLAGCAAGSPSDAGPVAEVSMHDSDNLDGSVLPKPYTVPHSELRSTDGTPFDLAAAVTKPLTLVFFGYTHCPDVCQVVMADIASAMARLDDDQRSKVAMVFVTTDPARDDARTLREYLSRFDPSFEGATGALSHIVRLGKALGVPIQRGAKLPSGGYDVAHGAQVLGVRPDRRAPYVWSEGTGPGALADDIGTILAGKVRSE